MKKPGWALRLLLGTLVTMAVAVFFAGASGQEKSAPPVGPAGQNQTQMPDGQWLLTGGEDPSGALASAALWNPATDTSLSLPSGLTVARAWHTAAVVPDGSVVLVGGVDSSGGAIGAPER